MLKLTSIIVLCLSAVCLGTKPFIQYATHAPSYDFGFQLFTAKQELYFQSLVNTDLGCLRYEDEEHCSHYPENLRKEIRRQTPEERERFFNAVHKLKNEDKIDGISRYDLFMYKHLIWNAPGSTKGPAFLGFHRIMTRMIEVALQQIDPTVTVPYWDVTLDSELPDPRDSVLWTAALFGNGNGAVVVGPWAYYPIIKVTNVAVEKDGSLDVEADLKQKTAKEIETQLIIPAHLSRGVGANSTIELWTRKYIEDNVLTRSFNELNFCHDGTFEMMHGHPHYYIGGMEVPGETTAPEDPYFAAYHSFIDYMWEVYRQKKQTNDYQRQWEYGEVTGPNCQPSKDDQQMNRAVLPFFPMTNRDGMSNMWTKHIYKYEKTPGSCRTNTDCRSDFLFCHQAKGQCMSRIMAGGSCKGLESQGKDQSDSSDSQPCYKSRCSPQGKCILTRHPDFSPADDGGTFEVRRGKRGAQQKNEDDYQIKVYVHQHEPSEAIFAPSVKVEGVSYEGLDTIELTMDQLEGGFATVNIPRASANEESIAAIRAFDSFGRVCGIHCPALDLGHPEGYRHTEAPAESFVPCSGIVRLSDAQQGAKRSRAKRSSEGEGGRLYSWDVPFDSFGSFINPKSERVEKIDDKEMPALLFMCRHSVFKQYEDVEMSELVKKKFMK